MFPLTGYVEVDETYVGGCRPGKPGRGAEGKSLVAVETDGRVMGRAYLVRCVGTSTFTYAELTG